MHLSRVCIRNFRNFANIDVSLSEHVILLGENRVGKSNFIHAIRLVLDASLPDSARQLKLSDIWDGAVGPVASDEEDEEAPATDPVVEVHLDFSGFEDDPKLLALLTDHRRPSEHTVARLSYVFRKKADVDGPATSEADFEFKVFGAEETFGIRWSEAELCSDVVPIPGQLHHPRPQTRLQLANGREFGELGGRLVHGVRCFA